jgi:hypothetical protein
VIVHDDADAHVQIELQIWIFTWDSLIDLSWSFFSARRKRP